MMAMGRPLIATRYGEALADTAVAESISEFEQIIPEIPYIGGKANSMTDTLVQIASMLALYRVLKRHGKSVEEIGDLAAEMTQAWIERFPRFARYLVGRFYMSGLNKRQLAEKTAVSQQRQYPGDFVRELVEGDGETFEWGVNYLECGVVKFFAEQNATEFTPQMCRLDYLLFPAIGIELQRSGTIAQGCTQCDFRFRRAIK
jgi:hypothetical protein